MQTSERYWRTADLRHRGFTRSSLAHAVRAGALLRVRRGRYVDAAIPAAVEAAARLGGRLDCTSLLRELGVFVADSHELHVQFERDDSRLPLRGPHVRAHWRTSAAEREALAVDVVDALAQACRCQAPRMAVATLDSALHLGVIQPQDLGDVFATLPRAYRRLRRLVDARAEAGTETLVRLMLRGLGCRIQLQVRIDGVGRVDLLVDGWLVVECDSRQFHGDLTQQLRDRRRDLAAARLGYVTLRLLAEDVLYRPEAVLAALRGVLVQGRPARTPARRVV